MNQVFRRRKPTLWMQVVLLLVLIAISNSALAAGTDFLDGTIDDAAATIFGAGQKWLYLAEGVGGLYAFHKTKNFFVLFGVIGVAVFINVLKGFVISS